MRILWLKTDLLLPLDKGGKLRTWHLMRHLAQRHEITYLSFADPHEPAKHVAGMREVAARVETIPRIEVRKASARFFARVAWHLLDPLPYAVGQYRSPAYRQRVRQLLAAQPFDLLVADFLFPVINVPRRLPCPAVLFTHNVEAEIWRRHAENAAGFVRRSLYRTQHRRMLGYEGAALRRFEGLLAVSDADRQTFTRLYPGLPADDIHVVPTGVDTEYFTPSYSPESSVSLVFTGSMDWLPNEDAMLWFCREILPRIRQEVPGVHLSIVGRDPTPAVSRLASEHAVHVTGRVDDVRPFISEAAIFVVPLRIGGGTRLKIFEAMAMAKAVVSTSVGAEGLPVTHDRDVLLADEPATFARSVVRLLRSVDERRALERAARALVEERFDWSAVARDLEGALVKIARAHVSSNVPRFEHSRVQSARLSRTAIEEKVL
jgi:sugar transferase (PEP-CTERM/EpsH1 system associated)